MDRRTIWPRFNRQNVDLQNSALADEQPVFENVHFGDDFTSINSSSNGVSHNLITPPVDKQHRAPTDDTQNDPIPSRRMLPYIPTLPSNVKKKNPWEDYKPLLRTYQAGNVILARKRSDGKRVAVSEINELSSILLLSQNQHKNLVTILGVYQFQNKNFIVSETMRISLNDLLGCPINFSEPTIAYICGQLLSGLQHLADLKICHERFDTSRVLFTKHAEVKIGDIAGCVKERTKRSREDEPINMKSTQPATLLKNIAAEIIFNGIYDSTEIISAMDNGTTRWSQDIKDFVRPDSRVSLNDLANEPFILGASKPANLEDLVFIGCFVARRQWEIQDTSMEDGEDGS